MNAEDHTGRLETTPKLPSLQAPPTCKGVVGDAAKALADLAGAIPREVGRSQSTRSESNCLEPPDPKPRTASSIANGKRRLRKHARQPLPTLS